MTEPQLRMRLRKATYKWTTSPFDDTIRSRVAHALSDYSRRRWWDWGNAVMWLTGRYDSGSAGVPRGRDLWWIPVDYVEGPASSALADLPVRHGCYTTTNYSAVRATNLDLSWHIFDLQDDGYTVQIGCWPKGYPYDDGRIQPIPGGLTRQQMRLLLDWYLIDHKVKAQWLGLRHWAYYKALHAAVHQRKPFSCQATPPRHAGGYSHWYCQLRRRHTGSHRFMDYTWSAGAQVAYAPAEDTAQSLGGGS